MYYTLEPAECDYANLDPAAQTDSTAFFDLLSDPARFSELTHQPARDYVLGPGRTSCSVTTARGAVTHAAGAKPTNSIPDYPQLGWDTSGRSSWEVPEALLIGKAFCVYWPHPKPVWPQFRLGDDFRLPILPYMERMRFIR